MSDIDYWDHRFAENWEERGGRVQTRTFMEILIRNLPDEVTSILSTPGASVTDVGCALGDGVDALAQAFPGIDARGVDISKIGIKKAEDAYPNSRFSFSETGIPYNRTDVCICSNTLEHINHWKVAMQLQMDKTDKVYIAMVPFEEENTGAGEHLHSFKKESFPTEYKDWFLFDLFTVDATPVWNYGKQAIVIYMKNSSGNKPTKPKSKKLKVTAFNAVPLMTLGLLPGMREAGIDTDFLAVPEGSWNDKPTEWYYEHFEKIFKDNRPDYVLFEGYHPVVPYALKEVGNRYGFGVIYWAIEDPCLFKSTLSMTQVADVVFTTTEEMIPKYKEHGVSADLLLFACNKSIHYKGKKRNDLSFDAVLAASCYTQDSRIRGFKTILEGAKNATKNLKVYGAYWDTVHGKEILGNESLFGGYLPNTDLPDLCASTDIILGVQCDDSSKTQTAMRPYEVLGCQGFHLTQWTPATENIFGDDKYLVTAKTREETIDKIHYYLKNKDEARKIAEAGQKFVYTNHTYKRRVEEVILPRLQG